MVDSVSAEARRKELLDESLGCVYPEDVASIKQRYKDTSLVLFKEQFGHQHADNRSFLSFGTRRSSTVSEYGNTPIIVRKSRSANGELSKVGEQWPSLRGKSSLSNYTLHEGKEHENDEDEEQKENEEEEETETEEESELKSNRSDGAGKTAQTEIGEKRKFAIVDGEAVSEEGKLHVASTSRQGGVYENYENVVSGNRKSFSQYDLQLQRPRGFIDEETRDEDAEDGIDRDNDDDDKDAVSMRTVLEVEGVDHKILLVRSSKKDEPAAKVHQGQDEPTAKPNQSQVKPTAKPHHEESGSISSKENVLKSTSEGVSLLSHNQRAASASKPPDIDHNAVLEKYVQNSSFVDNTLTDSGAVNDDFKSSNNQQSSSDWSKIELRIVEPSDMIVPDIAHAEKSVVVSEDNKSLTSKLLNNDVEDDDDDVVFIDEYTPAMGRSGKSMHKSPSLTKDATGSQDVLSSVEATPIPPKRRTKEHSDLSPTTLVKSQTAESESGIAEELDKSVEVEEDQNGLMSLPVRSPTPPKRSPRRSPRIPKSKEKNGGRHSSLDLPSDEDHSSTSRNAMSASPTSNNSKDSNRIFSFSSKQDKERSKSVSSLGSKKSRDKEKVTRSESGDVEAARNVAVEDEDSKCETPGKRVGVRSMVIDGTIKRNFIVIHPSDDSETIGLAPLSSFTNGSQASLQASKALSSVRSHITGMSSTKVESVKRISSKQEMKEELLNTSKELPDRESLSDGTGSEKLKRKKTGGKKQRESHVHGSSVSLPSPVAHTNSKVVVEASSSVGLSEVDCDLVSVSKQGIPLSSTKTTSRLCVIM